MADWFVEEGIGETRALLIGSGGKVLGAKVIWPGELRAGMVTSAKLASKTAGARRGTATLSDGREVLVDHLPKGVNEGDELSIRITRGAIAERGRYKLPQGRITTETSREAANWLSDAQKVRAFDSGDWEDIWHSASSGEVEFDGGTLLFSVTPAMTLIDIDGGGSPKGVSLAAVPAIARWLCAFDLGGNIGIDFPTIEAKADRRAVDEALATHLADWPHERTAMNGFGFVQIVSRLEGPSLLHRFASSRMGMCARHALRVAERAQGTGPVILLAVHPAVKSHLKPEWLAKLSQRTGKDVRIENDPSLALGGPNAQVLSV
ncbi:MAG: ribonuclease E/G [Pseudomonadota bacterium]|nr:ribonuclease E/G [Pseudomonadota bacterium]